VANYGTDPDYKGRVSILLGNGDGTFRTAVDYAAGVGPIGVAVGDFNGDGISDLAVANYGDANGRGGNLSVLLGNGDGSFRKAVNYATGSGPFAVAVADFNADGFLDLVVVNDISNTVSILLGRGDGTFRAARGFPTGLYPDSVVVGDFNGDGIADLVVANYGGNNVSVLLGNGDGTFRAAVNYAAGLTPVAVRAGDFNGDGILDLAVGNFLGSTVGVLLGNGDGTFQAAFSYAVGLNYNLAPSMLAVMDFNGNGDPDLAVAFGGGVRLLLGRADGTFQTTAISYVAGANPFSVAVGDFNGDGLPDLAVANPDANSVSILLNDGKGVP